MTTAQKSCLYDVGEINTCCLVKRFCQVPREGSPNHVVPVASAVLHPIVVGVALDAVDGPVRAEGIGLAHEEVVLLPDGHGNVSGGRSHGPSNHRVQSVKSESNINLHLTFLYIL
jgi:hypothetical protein